MRKKTIISDLAGLVLTIVQIFAICFWLRESSARWTEVAIVGVQGAKKGQFLRGEELSFSGRVPTRYAQNYIRKEDMAMARFNPLKRDLFEGAVLSIYDFDLNAKAESNSLGDKKNQAKFEIVGGTP